MIFWGEFQLSKTFIIPYKSGSKSAKDLGKSINAKLIKLEGSKFKPNPNKRVINWGRSSLPPSILESCQIVNNPTSVGICTNKLDFFRFMEDKDVRVPAVSFSSEEVLLDMCDKEEGKVLWVARTKLTGHSGEGIKLISSGDGDIPEAKLYTKYIPKQDEYRVHIHGGEVFDIQRKARNLSVPDGDVDWKVRNHANGFIFARNEGARTPKDVVDQALKAMDVVGLDFGAVDVVYNARSEEAWVLEINTAPGLTGETLDNYARVLVGV